MPTRQQKRARARAPITKRRKGSIAFLAAIVALLLAGGIGTALVRGTRPDVPQRGAIAGEHWHAPYEIELCGQPLAPYPFVEGEVHTHGDGQIHIHPQSEFFAGDNANLGAFFRTVETNLGQTSDGKRVLSLPNGARFVDGDTCDGSDEPQEFLITVNGQPIEGDPAFYTMREGDEILIRFGPEPAPDASPLPNPVQPLAGGGGGAPPPIPDGGPHGSEPQGQPQGQPQEGGEAEPSGSTSSDDAG